MGKYTTKASQFTPKPEPEAFQERVDQAKRKLQVTTQVELANALIAIRAEKDAAKDALSEINVRLVAVEQILIDAFETVGVTSIRLESGESISTQIKPWARIDNKQAFRDWCLKNGYRDSLTLPWQTTNALVADRLSEGLPEPDGISTYKQTAVILRKGRS